MLTNRNTPRVLTETLQVHLELVPPIDRPREEEFSELLTRAGRIVSDMKTPQSTITALLKRLRQNLSALEKDEVREGLKREISTALEVGGIPLGMIHAATMVFVNLSMNDIELVYAEPGESVVLYLRCLAVVAFRRIREMVLSGLLLRLFSEAIKQFIQSRPRVQLVVQADDFQSSLSCFVAAAGTFVFLQVKEIQDAKKSPKIAISAPSHNFVGPYLRN